MAEWSQKTEQLIREIGDFLDTNIRDVVNPKASTLATSARVAFNAKSKGVPLFKRLRDELGIDIRKDWEGGLKSLADLCEANGSDAGDKIKKVLPVAKQLFDEFGFGVHTAPPGKLEAMKMLKKIKKKGIDF